MNIETQPWYHGLRSREDVIQVLKQPGDWLLRATDGRINQTELVISILDNKLNLKNYTLKYHETFGKWQLTILTGKKTLKLFDNVWALVTHYRNHMLPGGVMMRRAIYREKWLVQHDLIKYDKAKDLLGSGNFCDVYKARFEQTTHHFVDVAVKVCHKSDSETDQVTEADREAMMALVREGRIMSYYSHENVIQFYGVACDHKPIMIVMEYCTGGGLDCHLQKEGENIEVGERVLFCYEAAKGMNYLHRQGCIHRDLAARNCLISHRGVIKIADFGLSDMVNDKAVLKQQVPLRWMAPECLVKEPKYSRKSDVWSYGVLIFEVFNLGMKPWPKDEYKRIATWIRRCQMPELPKIMPNEIKEIVKRIWVKEPEKRPEFRQMVPDLFEIHHDIYRPPEPRLCSTNRIPGVTRCDFDEKQEAHHRVVDVNQQTEETKTKEVENPENENIVTHSTSPTVATNLQQEPPSAKTAEGSEENDATVSKPPPPLEPEFKPIPEVLALKVAPDVPIIPQKETPPLKPVTEIPPSNRKQPEKKVPYSTTTTTTTTTTVTMEKLAGRTTAPPAPQHLVGATNLADDKNGLKKKNRSLGASQSKKRPSVPRPKIIKTATKEK